MSMFDPEKFKADCCAARSPQAMQEVVANAVSAPGAVIEALGEPRRSEARMALSEMPSTRSFSEASPSSETIEGSDAS